jgi:hypothetical protein
LIDRLLWPLEEEYLGEARSGAIVPRVKAIRGQLLPDMVHGRLAPPERERRWRQLAHIYLAQQVSCYPADYLAVPSVDRILETIERYEEDLNDRATVHGNLKAIIQVGDAIEVDPHHDRREAADPLMSRLENDLQGMLDVLARESPLIAPRPDAQPEIPSLPAAVAPQVSV